MAKRDQSGRWATIVAEAESSEATHIEVAKKHGVSLPALKYHIYKARKEGSAPQPRLLPVRTSDSGAAVQVELGQLRLSFRSDCDPGFVAAVVRALAKDEC